MSAGTAVRTPGAGESYRTHDVGGVKHPVGKLAHGDANTVTDITAGTPLPCGIYLPAGVQAPGDAANGIDVDVTRVQGSVNVDSELPAAAAASDEQANPTAPAVRSGLQIFSRGDSDWWRAASAEKGAGGQPAEAILASAGQLRHSDASYYSIDSAANTGDGATGQRFQSTGAMAWNGSTWERQRSNLSDQTALASAARTASASSAALTNYNHSGVLVGINVSVAGAALTVQIREANGVVALGEIVTTVTTGRWFLELYPGATTAPLSARHVRVAGALPRDFVIVVTPGDATSTTYSISYQLIV